MPRDTSVPPDDALEDVAYLSRSGNRLQVLELVATEPHTPREIREVADASRSTLRRILAELEERGWAERTTDGDVVATAKGEHVVTAFEPLIGSMRAIRELDEAVTWLPSDELSLGLHHFSDATVRRGDRTSPSAEASYLHDRLRDASSLVNLTSVGPPLSMMKTTRDGVASGRLTATTVLTERVVEYLQSQPEQLPLWQEYITAGARVYYYEGAIPCHLFIVDETVLIGNNQPEVVRPCEFIETDDEAVLTWAREMIESYRADANRLGPETFAQESITSLNQND